MLVSPGSRSGAEFFPRSLAGIMLIDFRWILDEIWMNSYGFWHRFCHSSEAVFANIAKAALHEVN